MENEFIPFSLAIDLKELGFDELSLGYYNSKKQLRIAGQPDVGYDSEEMSNPFLNSKYCSAPLYQQAFKWFREKYNAHHNIKNLGNNYESWIFIRNKGIKWRPITRCGYHTVTYQEAELECLIKLIELCKKNL